MSTDNIPKKFCTEGQDVIVRTVKDLKDALSELPDELPVHSSFAQCAKVTVYNVGHGPHMELEDFESEEEEFHN